ncbi:arsenate reductase (glutaredoxin) [Chitinimonas arctica]|uniref:Arsenate reductase n=1 Tax=Chitinimonas arctica TaxID=2594795 RepID=A0A516SGL0_9NEIS|nr:arsenate reductase (glutaredoxin) [Chitinimonas arctica]QDQ27158.1 arsenate reductase (glutaredoxin) [Chitinimonas arctica]
MTMLYHNPRCSKSRETLALLEQRGVQATVVHYLETPPDASTLRRLLELLGFDDPRQLMRRQEAEYAALGLDDPGLTHSRLVAAMVAHPHLIERPIVVRGERAVLGRPPENIHALFPTPS